MYRQGCEQLKTLKASKLKTLKSEAFAKILRLYNNKKLSVTINKQSNFTNEI